MASFKTWGRESGACEHDHPTRLSAAACAAEFNRKAREAGTPGDREVYVVVDDGGVSWVGWHGDGSPGKWVGSPSAF